MLFMSLTLCYLILYGLADLKRFVDLFMIFCVPLGFTLFYVFMGYGFHVLYTPYMYLDNVSVLLLYITFIVLILSLLSHKFVSSSLSLVYLTFVGLLITSYFVFTSSNLLVLYIAYEASLIPISYSILKWGSYPDKGVSALMMLLFTGFFTLPLSVLLLSFYMDLGSFSIISLTFLPISPSLGFAFWLFMAFSVKLPLYGVHYWLPMAHVEAPTFGSMILAGLLLKMGGCGLVRFMPLFSQVQEGMFSYMMFYFIMAVVLAAVVCCVQSDMKRLVAYSSVLHMSILPMLLISMNTMSYLALLMVMVFHGLSSPALFYYVGVVYEFNKTRLMALLRGLLLFSPMASFWGIMIFMMNIPVPPIPAFIAEVMSFMSVFPLINYWVLPLVGVVMFLVMLYSLSWFIPLVFTPSTYSFSSSQAVNVSSFLILFSFSFIMIGMVSVMFVFTA